MIDTVTFMQRQRSTYARWCALYDGVYRDDGYLDGGNVLGVRFNEDRHLNVIQMQKFAVVLRAQSRADVALAEVEMRGKHRSLGKWTVPEQRACTPRETLLARGLFRSVDAPAKTAFAVLAKMFFCHASTMEKVILGYGAYEYDPEPVTKEEIAIREKHHSHGKWTVLDARACTPRETQLARGLCRAITGHMRTRIAVLAEVFSCHGLTMEKVLFGFGAYKHDPKPVTHAEVDRWSEHEWWIRYHSDMSYREKMSALRKWRQWQRS